MPQKSFKVSLLIDLIWLKVCCSHSVLLFVLTISFRALDNLNPIWQPFAVSVSRLCGGDQSLSVRFVVRDEDLPGQYTQLGAVDVRTDKYTNKIQM